LTGLTIDPTTRGTPNNGGCQEFLTVHDVADLLRCSACTVRRLRYRGHLRAVAVRGSTMLRYRREDVYALLEKRAVGR
jgi:excisionase family DNA binding protein